MEDFTIAIYCFTDDFLKKSAPKQATNRKMSDAEIITTSVVAARYFGGNLTTASHYMRCHHGSELPDKSNFNRHMHRLADTMIAIFIAFGQRLKLLNTESQYLIDSFPVAVCKNVRIPNCKLLQEEAYRGYNASKKEFFYGFKVQLITTAQGLPVEFYITAGSIHDITAFQSMNIDLPVGSELFADSAYTDYELEEYYKELEQIYLLVERKSNSKRADTPAMKFIKKYMRKRIETTFSEITAFFPKKIHAVTAEGFLLKVFLFIFAYTLNKSLLIAT